MKALLMCLVLVVAGVVAFNYWNGVPLLSDPRAGRPAAVGTSGTVDVNAARERGAEVGEKVAVTAAKVRDSAQEAALTSKIKAKMVLDDTIKARSIDVTTVGATVTVSGTVRSMAERDRALQLARETAGVVNVVDQLKIEQ
jgi:osmotically-inducible protein OsmY